MEQFTLSELNKLILATLDSNLEPSYWVVAEISELSVNQKGHCYLELVQKENDQIIAKSRATIWSYTYRNLSAWFKSMAGQDLSPGIKILVNLKVTFHEVYGFSLNIKDIDPSFTIGERELQRQKIVQQLQADGVVDMNKQLPLPLVPQQVAVISSPTAAGYEDFMNQLAQNEYGYQVDVQFYSSIMQGNDAPASIIEALHKIHTKNQASVVVIIRGGGSKLDLDCFDNYELASHIAQFPIPIVTGIGHERDSTISDMVAHTELKTPTAVAAFIIDGFASYEAQMNDLFDTISNVTRVKIQTEQYDLNELVNNLAVLSKQQLIHQQHDIENKQNQFQYFVGDLLKENNNNLSNIEKRVKLLDPVGILRRGYSISYVNDQPIGKNDIKIGDQLKTITAKQTLISKISSIK